MIDLDDYDWRKVFEYAGDVPEEGADGAPSISACIGTETDTSPVLRKEVERIIAAVEGENDGPSWGIVVELSDGRFAFVEAGCDYTGWDCQAGGTCTVDNDLEHLKTFGIPQGDVVRMKWF